jgi:L-fuconolactonase
MFVDAHHHVWDPAAADYPWMTDELAAIRRRFDPDDLAPELDAAGFDATVLVQTRASLDETREFLALAAAIPWIRGVVGWADLTDPAVGAVLGELRAATGGDRLVGIRHQVHDEPDPDWLRRPAVQRGIADVGGHGLAFDLLIRPRELPAAIETVAAHPDVRFVVDHLAKPEIRTGGWEPWARGLAALGALPNAWCKVSGLVTEADWTTWTAAEMRPYVDHALATFGPDRLMFGSDWPVCLLAASYAEVVDLARSLLPPGEAERQAMFGGTATAVYRLAR